VAVGLTIWGGQARAEYRVNVGDVLEVAVAGVPELRNRAADGNSSGHRWSNHDHAVAAAGSGTSTSGGSTSAGRSPTGHIDVAQWFNNHPDFARAATTLSEAGASRSGAVTNLATTTTDPTAGVGAKAFALVADPRILTFDEATSAPRNEQINESLNQIILIAFFKGISLSFDIWRLECR